MIPFVELKTQFKSIEHEIRQAIDRVLERSSFILGEELEAFEREFADYLGVQFAVGVASGTDAIHLALTAAGVGPGDEVITAANTCVPTVAGIRAADAVPVLVDVDPLTLTLDPSLFDAAVTSRTKAVVPVHLYGHPCDMAPILDASAERGIVVIEDCAQAHGARYNDRSCGTLGTAAAFSFYPSKNLGAFGDAGAVVTNDAGIAAKLRCLRNYGAETRYEHRIEGFNSRLDELQAAILRAKLPHLDTWNAARRGLAEEYSRRLAGLPVTVPVEAEWARHCFHLYVIRAAGRDALRDHLAGGEIGTQIHYPIPIHLQEAYGFLGKRPGSFAVSERAAAEVISLPIYPELTLDAVGEVCRAISEFFG